MRADPGLAELIGHEVPSPEAARTFLYALHEEEKIEQAKQQRLPDQFAYIPSESEPLAGLARSLFAAWQTSEMLMAFSGCLGHTALSMKHWQFHRRVWRSEPRHENRPLGFYGINSVALARKGIDLQENLQPTPIGASFIRRYCCHFPRIDYCLNVATRADQLALALSVKVPLYVPVEVASSDSFAAGEPVGFFSRKAYPLPAVGVPV